jgi:hypothetical protein
MNPNPSRRTFLKKSAAAALAAPLITSLEECALKAQEQKPAPAPAAPPAKDAMPMGKIGSIKISRLICGGNLVSGWAHSRDLLYVSPLLKHYFTEDKIMETWSLCEQHGINTMLLDPSDQRAVDVYQKHRARGGRIQYLAQIGPDKADLKTPVKRAKDAGAVGLLLQGNHGDEWTRDGELKLMGELLGLVKEQGMIAGVAGHELRTVMAVEKAGLAPDFYMKTLHSTNYWSAQRPDQNQEVVDNYRTDNYWCREPKETIAYMSELKRPWIAYKVLAAGAIHPKAGFEHAFANGADFAAVGMFDFQIAENAGIAKTVVDAAQNRDRDWYA